MVYRRYPYAIDRRRQYYKTSPVETKSHNSTTSNIETVKHGDNIPMPNESDASTNESGEKQANRGLSVIRFLKSHIKLEEIILLGLIFFLLDEGLNDDFLLLILIYILLS